MFRHELPRKTRLRLGRRKSAAPVAPPYLVRLALLMGLALIAIVTLGQQSKFSGQLRGWEIAPVEPDTLSTVLTPSPLDQLPDGVFLATLPAAAAVQDPEDSKSADVPAKPEHDELLVDPSLMASVLDKSSRISPRAYYHLMDLASRAAPAELAKRAKSEREITLGHLATEPEKHRGELIYLEGRLRGLVRFDATRDPKLNPNGLRDLYQGDLFTRHGHPYPYVLIMHEVPEGIPRGLDLSENVTFAGYFLQLWRYQAPGRLDRIAPVLVGRMLTWTPAPQAEASSRFGAYLAIAIALLSVGLVATVWAMNRRSPRAFRIGKGGKQDVFDPEAIKAELARLAEKKPLPPDEPSPSI